MRNEEENDQKKGLFGQVCKENNEAGVLPFNRKQNQNTNPTQATNSTNATTIALICTKRKWLDELGLGELGALRTPPHPERSETKRTNHKNKNKPGKK